MRRFQVQEFDCEFCRYEIPDCFDSSCAETLAMSASKKPSKPSPWTSRPQQLDRGTRMEIRCELIPLLGRMPTYCVCPSLTDQSGDPFGNDALSCRVSSSAVTSTLLAVGQLG